MRDQTFKVSAVKTPVRAIETSGIVNEEGELHLDEPLTELGTGRVRVILILPERQDMEEREWLRAAASNPAFDFLGDAEEDIYTLADGRPFDDEG